MSPSNVVFVCTHNSARSQIAEGFARQLCPAGTEVASAGTVATSVHPIAIATMKEHGIDISHQTSKTIADLGRTRFDLVITLCDSARSSCPVFAGAPAIVHWSLPDPSATVGTEKEVKAAFERSALDIKELVSNLFNRGYLAAFVRQKDNLENILNCLSEGVMAHDLNRHVFFFSRGAEEITGLSESEVLGKDCRDVFTPSLCGENCSFCNEGNAPVARTKQYPTVFLGRDGTRKEFDVTVVPLKDERGEHIGVVTSFDDRTEVKDLQRQLGAEQEFRGIIGQDHKMQHIYELVRDLAQCDFPVAISGESGTGKELVARAIHDESPRKDKMFVPINCGALPEGTLESELFGHVRGAFTGAIRDKKGRFSLADNGTIFLDEVAELSQAMQVKLLRVLQEGSFEPVGSETTITVNVRIISATNKTLKNLIKDGRFREDLFYRLSVVPVEMPPLRDRRNDIPLLAQQFLEKISTTLGRPGTTLSQDTVSMLMSHSWPGNVRQLQNAIQFAMIKCRDTTILPQHLPPEIGENAMAVGKVPDTQPGKVGRKPKLSEGSVIDSLRRAGGNKAKAARILGVGRATLYNFLKQNPHLASEVSDQ